MVRIEDTSDETFDTLFKFGKAMKKEPVACKVDYWGLLEFTIVVYMNRYILPF